MGWGTEVWEATHYKQVTASQSQVHVLHGTTIYQLLRLFANHPSCSSHLSCYNVADDRQPQPVPRSVRQPVIKQQVAQAGVAGEVCTGHLIAAHHLRSCAVANLSPALPLTQTRTPNTPDDGHSNHARPDALKCMPHVPPSTAHPRPEACTWQQQGPGPSGTTCGMGCGNSSRVKLTLATVPRQLCHPPDVLLHSPPPPNPPDVLLSSPPQTHLMSFSAPPYKPT